MDLSPPPAYDNAASMTPETVALEDEPPEIPQPVAKAKAKGKAKANARQSEVYKKDDK